MIFRHTVTTSDADHGGLMSTEDCVWRLMRQDELVGEIVVDGSDFPWLEGRFVPAPAFSEVKPLFDRVRALAEARDPGLGRGLRRDRRDHDPGRTGRPGGRVRAPHQG